MPFPHISLGGQLYFYDDFLGAALAGEIAGTSENSGTAAIVVAQEGGVGGLVTGGTSGNTSQFTTGLNHLPSSGSIIVQWRAKPVTDITSRAMWYGISDTVSLEFPVALSTATFTAAAADCAGFLYDTGGTVPGWYAVTVKAGSVQTQLITINNATAVPAAGVYEQFRIEVTPEGDVTFYYGSENGLETDQGYQQVAFIENGVTASVLYTPMACLETRTSAAKTAYVDALLIQSSREDNL